MLGVRNQPAGPVPRRRLRSTGSARGVSSSPAAPCAPWGSRRSHSATTWPSCFAASVLSGFAGALLHPAVRAYPAQRPVTVKAEAFALFSMRSPRRAR
ncbi:hypothetical protein LT493_10040 [Streptomyces tricolor]|nr:hypothetical protein [Streptomyces tricolor]